MWHVRFRLRPTLMALCCAVTTVCVPMGAGAVVDVEGVHGGYDACIAKFTAAGLRDEVNQLDASNHTFVVDKVYITSSGAYNTQTVAADASNASNGVGTGATINWNPNPTRAYFNGSPSDLIASDACADLYHEMHHAVEDDTGSRNNNLCWYRPAPNAPLENSHLKTTEVDSTLAENRYRASQGLPAHAYYVNQDPNFSSPLTYQGNSYVAVPPPGTVCQNDPNKTPPPPPPPSGGGCNISGGVGCTGQSFGDPNILTYNGYAYPFQMVGEFIMTRSTLGDFEIQMRTAPVPGHDNLTLNTAIALRAGAHRFAVYEQGLPDADPHPLRFDGKPAAPKDGQVTALPGGGSILVSGSDIILQSPSGEKVRLHVATWGSFRFINVAVSAAPNRSGGYVGILGDASGSQSHDLRTRDGKSIALANAYGNVAQTVGLAGAFPPATTAFHAFVNRTFADSWRVGQQESLFDYAPGTSTQSFTDRSYPRSDFSPATSLLPDAVSTCRNAGISGAELAGCVSDVTGTRSTIFASALAQTKSLLSIELGNPVDTLRQLIPNLPNVPSIPGIPIPRL